MRLGFVELVDLCNQDEIALRQTVDFVGPDRGLDSSPGKEEVWVVPLLLRKLAYAVYEREGFAKVGLGHSTPDKSHYRTCAVPLRIFQGS
jgi:hypothetical protein